MPINGWHQIRCWILMYNIFYGMLFCLAVLGAICMSWEDWAIHIQYLHCTCHHDDVTKWKHIPRNRPFVRGIHRWPVNSPHKGKRRRALMFSLICAWINGWVNKGEAGDLRRHRTHYDVSAKYSDKNAILTPCFFAEVSVCFSRSPSQLHALFRLTEIIK